MFIQFLFIPPVGCVHVVTGKDKSFESQDHTVNILGKSGKVMYSKKGEDEKKKIKIEFKKIEEKDAEGKALTGGGKAHVYKTFANQDFSFTEVRDTLYQGVNCTNLNFTAKLDAVDAELTVEVYIVHNESEFVNDDESFVAKRGALKFNIKVSSLVLFSLGQGHTLQVQN